MRASTQELGRNQAQKSEGPAPPCPGFCPVKPLLFLAHGRIPTSWEL